MTRVHSRQPPGPGEGERLAENHPTPVRAARKREPDFVFGITRPLAAPTPQNSRFRAFLGLSSISWPPRRWGSRGADQNVAEPRFVMPGVKGRMSTSGALS